MTDFGLSDSVNASESLLKPVGIPGDVVVDHEVSAMEVDTFSGSVSSYEDFHGIVTVEHSLSFSAFISGHASVNADCSVIAQECAYFREEVVQCIPMFGEDDELFPFSVRGEHFGVLREDS